MPDGQLIVSRFAVDQVLARRRCRMIIRDFRARAGHFLINREEQSNFFEALGAQLFCGGNLRRDNSFRVACAAAVDEFIVFTRSDERRHGVHVRRQDDTRPVLQWSR